MWHELCLNSARVFVLQPVILLTGRHFAQRGLRPLSALVRVRLRRAVSLEAHPVSSEEPRRTLLIIERVFPATDLSSHIALGAIAACSGGVQTSV